jgi:hypothetical protein
VASPVPLSPPARDPTWGMCRFCAVAVPPNATECPECGAPDPIASRDLPRLRGSVRRRLRTVNFLRSLIVVGVAAGLAYTMVSLVLTGPPTVADPLTTAGSYTIGPGNFTVISGEITGGDFVLGNFTTVDPVGTNLVVAVYNSTQWVQFENGQDPAPQWEMQPAFSARIIYSANYTDNFYFVFTNPYAPSTHLSIIAYIVTTYQSNVGDDGFA